MYELAETLKSSPVVYITRDIERALGLSITTPGYWIITNDGPLAKDLAIKHSNILIIKAPETLDTIELLSAPATTALLKKLRHPKILVFKNTKPIEKFCTEHGLTLLNPSAELANMVEQKLSQLTWLGPLKKYLPPHKITTCQKLLWQGKKYIVQFNHAHTGSGTILIKNEKQIEELKTKFPNREVRMLKYIAGPVFTNNNVVWGNKILCGNINYQITGLKPFTDRPFATIGNDWALPGKLLNKTQIAQYTKIVADVGKKLLKDGWKGLFGVDIIMDKKTGKLYFLEINARQAASTTYESQLQQLVIPTREESLSHNNKYVTTFEAHLASLLGLPTTSYKLQVITDGAQILQRVLDGKKKKLVGNKVLIELQKSGFNVINYTNKDPGDDLLRIQNKHGIMGTTKTFNASGKKIISLLRSKK